MTKFTGEQLLERLDNADWIDLAKLLKKIAEDPSADLKILFNDTALDHLQERLEKEIEKMKEQKLQASKISRGGFIGLATGTVVGVGASGAVLNSLLKSENKDLKEEQQQSPQTAATKRTLSSERAELTAINTVTGIMITLGIGSVGLMIGRSSNTEKNAYAVARIQRLNNTLRELNSLAKKLGIQPNSDKSPGR